MHREHVESYRQQLADLQDRLEKLRMVVRKDLDGLEQNDRRRLAWPRIRDRITILVDNLGDLRNDLLDLEPGLGG